MPDHSKLISNLDPERLLQAQERILGLMARVAPLSESLNAICQFSEESIPSMMASVLVFEDSSQSLCKGGYGRLPSSFQDAVDGMTPGPVAGSCGTAAYRKSRVICQDVRIDPLWIQFREFAVAYGIQSAWSTPILDLEGNLTGVFGMYYGDCRVPSIEDLKLVDHFVNLASIAIERHRLEMRDQLTGLGSRKLLEKLVASLRINPSAKQHSIALLDLDDFKVHNAHLGRQTADSLLKQAAERIFKYATKTDFAIRFDGNQFILITPADGDSMRERFKEVIIAFKKPFHANKTDVRLTVSAGIVDWDPRTTDFDNAFHQVEKACVEAKKLGGDRWVEYNEIQRKSADERLRIALIVKHCIADQRLVPYLQPIIHIATGLQVGFEALARLTGLEETIHPSTFIPISEENSLIQELGISIYRSTCEFLSSMKLNEKKLTANINISILQLMREGFPFQVAEIAEEFGLPHDQICFEATETQWLDLEGPAQAALLQLKSQGFKLALDDFGTGHSSFNLLQQVPFDYVKIDRSFTSRLEDRERGADRCKAALEMATACGMCVIAEGVETQKQSDILQGMGCEFGQGYLWGPPIPCPEALKWFESRNLV